ncbi:MAG TPA: hypothetical protein VEU47_05730 [Candidatus Cybelea sp.]|nr:hypothetical protein [Candidatus Cybelea sp.]
MFFKRRIPVDNVREGAVFQRNHPNNLVERAKVVWIGKDSFGIPHVRFQVSYVRPDRQELEGTKVLALSSFTERYQPSAAA